ncbi:MAG TPA: DUF488 domain-containing protein [Kofleriaceae bacterium]
MPATRPIYTIGHSTHSLAELVEMLQAHGISQLADIRSIRRSRRNPQFNEAAFGRALTRRGIRYAALPALGGRRNKAERPPRRSNAAWEHSAFRNYADYATTAEFRGGLAELRALAAKRPTAIMCAEATWWRCHRRIVADHLLARHVPVLHVMTKTRAEPATLTPFAKVERGTVSYPPPRSRRRS